MGQRAGLVYGTRRSRKRDRIDRVGAEGLEGSVGHVNGTGLNGGGL